MSPENNERMAFHQLKAACRKRDLNEIKEYIVVWCNHYLSSKKVKTVEGILQNSDWSDLHQQIIFLQNELYFQAEASESIKEFSASELIQNIFDLRKLMRKRSKAISLLEKYSLPPLYKA